VSVVFAWLVSATLVTPVSLLTFMCLITSFSALEAPAWQAIVPQLVPAEDLAAAVAANSVGVNINRAVGPALAGVIIVSFGIAPPFWLDAFSNAGVIAVLLSWHPESEQRRICPQKSSGEQFEPISATLVTTRTCGQHWLALSVFFFSRVPIGRSFQ
jgi:MFS family permease